MKRAVQYLALMALLAGVAGCGQQQGDSDAIRAAINQHLSSLNTINLSAMDMNIVNVSIQGNQAQALVEFRLKSGPPQGSPMQVSYSLAKQDSKWVVQNSTPMGGMTENSGSGQNPQQNPTPPSPDSLPDFRSLVNSGSGSAMPPEHPPVNSHGGTLPQ